MSDGIVRLVEEVPGVPKDEAWYIFREREGALWHGPTKSAGERWAAERRIGIDVVEFFEP